MAAALLRSSVGLALPRGAAPASSRLSSAGRNTYANTCRVRAMHSSDSDYSGGGPGDKGDGFFAAAAAIGTFLFFGLVDGEFDFCWGRENTTTTTTSRQPRTTSSRRRR